MQECHSSVDRCALGGFDQPQELFKHDPFCFGHDQPEPAPIINDTFPPERSRDARFMGGLVAEGQGSA
jgi:hypothetical protein